jgi:signal transduction histidine kinase
MIKLSNKSSLYFLITTLIVFFISGVIIFFVIQYIIKDEIDETLTEQKEQMIHNLDQADKFEELNILQEIIVEIDSVSDSELNSEGIFSDTLIQQYDYEDQEYDWEPYRQLKFTIVHHDTTRMLTLRKSLIETDDIIETIFFSLLLVFFIMILTLIAVNSFTMKKLWQPFQIILNRIDTFDFRSHKDFKSVSSDIKEFNDLNDKLLAMTKKLTEDYFTLKEFSENASHEMQTPLAIIQAKLELLFQQNKMNDQTMTALNTVYHAVNRLSRLHKELNLLTRIENKEFTEQENISFKSLLESHLENFIDIIEMKKLKLKTDIQADYIFTGNKYLIETMISNLLSNAIQHNIKPGWIIVILSEKKFTITNSGNKPDVSTELLFQRFRKSKQSAESSGLGLSIVKQICLMHDFEIHYNYKNNEHILIISFEK